MSEGLDGKELVAPGGRALSLDLDFITRNVRDLSKTAQFSHMKELEELHQMAYTNLKAQLAPDKPLAADPQLALEAFKTLSTVVMQVVEVKRKAADTLIKARNLIDVFHPDASFLEDSGEGDDPESGVSLEDSDGGVFGGLGVPSHSSVDAESADDRVPF